MSTYNLNHSSDRELTLTLVAGDTINFTESLDFIQLYEGLAHLGYMLLQYRFVGESEVHSLRFEGQSITRDSLSLLHFVRADGGLLLFSSNDALINGSAAVDLLYAAVGGSDIFSGAGKDEVIGGIGNDKLYGGEGNDRLFGGSGDDALFGDQGDDILFDDGGNNQLYGGTGKDVLTVSGSGTNYLDGGNGDDTLFSSGSSNEANQLLGGTGNDYLFGHANDLLSGGDGDDYLSGGALLDGGDGDDQLDATRSIDRANLIGGSGKDKLTGSSFDDLLQGGDGDDIILDYSGNNTVDGGGGNDFIFIDTGDHQQIEGGTGADVIVALRGNNLISGGAGSDLLIGGDGIDMMDGGDDDDYFIGGVSDVTRDYLTQFASNAVHSGFGNDAIDGGAGFDLALYPGAPSRYQINQVDGKLIVIDSLGETGHDELTNVEALMFEHDALAFGIDTVAAKLYRLYQAAFDRIPDADGLGYWMREMQVHKASLYQVALDFIGSPEFQQIYGKNLDAEQILHGFYQNILGREPDPTGLSYWKNEIATGKLDWAGVLINFSESPENKEQTKVAIEQGIHFNYAMPYFQTASYYTSADTKIFSNISNIILWGDAGNNVLAGDIGNDRLLGGAGNDLLIGRDGDDRLDGGDGNDQLLGGNGNDNLFGGTGNDFVDGGNGIDFAYFGTIEPTLLGIENYTYSMTDDVLTVQDNSNAANITQLKNVERIAFPMSFQPNGVSSRPSTVIAFDVDGIAGDVYKLWHAALGDDTSVRDEKHVLGYSINQADGGRSLEEIAEDMLTIIASFRHPQGPISDLQFINELYQSSFDRDADTAGLQYWLNEISSSHMNRAQVLMSFAQSPEFSVKIIGSMESGIEYVYDITLSRPGV